MNIEYTREDIIDMISTLQDEQTKLANAKYNFDLFKNKSISSLQIIQDKIKVGSELWKNQDRNVRLYEPQYWITKDEKYVSEYENLRDLIAKRPNDIIKNIEAFGIFSIHISI